MIAPAVTLPLVRPSYGSARYLIFYAIVLTGYACAGKGFAYFGLPPLFIGEVLLMCGVALLFWCRGTQRVFAMGQALVILPLVAWGLFCTIPYLRVHGLDSLRDAMVFGYSAFAFIVAALIIEDPNRLKKVLGWYWLFARIVLIAIPIVFILRKMQVLPVWPWGGPIIQQKEGDALVHLAGIFAFCATGMAGRISWPWAILLTCDFALMGANDRAGMFAFLIVLTACMILNRKNQISWRFISIAIVALLFLAVSGLRIEMSDGKNRELSFQQLVNNILSLTSDVGNEGMDSTKEWRTDWWWEIRRYTLHGKYFWTGKGFGVNLADDDGFQVYRDNSLRTPHNVTMTYLARGGVPGVTLWLITQISWGIAMARNYWKARKRGELLWTSIFQFLTLYWVACLFNGSFDVFLEGPMGGIWFWTIYGLGLASMWIYRQPNPGQPAPRKVTRGFDVAPTEPTQPPATRVPKPALRY